MWPDEPAVVSSHTATVTRLCFTVSVTVQEFRTHHHKQVVGDNKKAILTAGNSNQLKRFLTVFVVSRALHPDVSYALVPRVLIAGL